MRRWELNSGLCVALAIGAIGSVAASGPTMQAHPGPCTTPAPSGAVHLVHDACRAVPSLSDPTASEWQRAEALRRWTQSWLIFANSQGDDVQGLHAMSPDIAYQAFRDARIAVLCGGAAWTLAMVERSVGIEAWSYDFGREGILTHQVTLVKAEGKWLTQDPTYGVTFEVRNRQPVDLTTLTRYLATPRRNAGIRLRREAFPKRVVIRDADRASLIPAWQRVVAPGTRARACDPMPDARSLCIVPSVTVSQQTSPSRQRALRSMLRRMGRAPGPYSLMLDSRDLSAPAVTTPPSHPQWVTLLQILRTSPSRTLSTSVGQ